MPRKSKQQLEEEAKKKEVKEKEEQKKLAPDAVSDEEDKHSKYEDPETMAALAEDEDEDDEILGAPGETLDLPPEEKVEKKEEKKEIKEPEKKEKESEEEQSLSDIVDEVTETSEKPEEKVEQKEEEKQEQVQLSDDAQKVLGTYKGDLSQKVEQLIISHNQLLAKYNSLANLNNVITELGWTELKPDQLVINMKELKSAAFDFMQNPEILDLIDAISQGNIPEDFAKDHKTVNDFMPEGEMFNMEDSMTDSSSPSYKARESWEDHREKQAQKGVNLRKLIAKKKEGVPSLDERFEKSKEALQQKLGEIQQFAKDEYDVSDEDFGEFQKKFKSFDTELIKIAFAVFAKQNGIESKKALALKNNKDKSFAEADISESVEEKESIKADKDKEMEKEYDEAFTDWSRDDNVVTL